MKATPAKAVVQSMVFAIIRSAIAMMDIVEKIAVINAQRGSFSKFIQKLQKLVVHHFFKMTVIELAHANQLSIITLIPAPFHVPPVL